MLDGNEPELLIALRIRSKDVPLACENEAEKSKINFDAHIEHFDSEV